MINTMFNPVYKIDNTVINSSTMKKPLNTKLSVPSVVQSRGRLGHAASQYKMTRHYNMSNVIYIVLILTQLTSILITTKPTILETIKPSDSKQAGRTEVGTKIVERDNISYKSNQGETISLQFTTQYTQRNKDTTNDNPVSTGFIEQFITSPVIDVLRFLYNKGLRSTHENPTQQSRTTPAIDVNSFLIDKAVVKTHVNLTFQLHNPVTIVTSFWMINELENTHESQTQQSLVTAVISVTRKPTTESIDNTHESQTHQSIVSPAICAIRFRTKKRTEETHEGQTHQVLAPPESRPMDFSCN